jgi:hypothetical protein
MGTLKKINLVVLILIAIASFFWVRHLKNRVMTLQGAVITQNADPRKQLPIANVEVIASGAISVSTAKSDSSGLFKIDLRKPLLRGEIVKLKFRHPDYEPLDLTVGNPKALSVAMLAPVVQEKPVEDALKHTISNVVVRYSIKSATVMTIGSAVRLFEAVNKGNVPCMKHHQCSPDRRWKAATATATIEAGAGNEFRNARASCIAGPCPFTKIDSSGLERDGQTASVSATTWSDTATFLLEAEVVHPTVSDVVRNSYPVIFGDALNFTLPHAAEGVSIQADMNGETIIFPVGPALVMSWADCNARMNPDQTRVYRCELKPGYRWLNPGT